VIDNLAFFNIRYAHSANHVSPQGKGEYEFWSTDEMINSLMALLDEVNDFVAVDINRIYLTGYSVEGMELGESVCSILIA
jgi:predicted peptidase